MKAVLAFGSASFVLSVLFASIPCRGEPTGSLAAALEALDERDFARGFTMLRPLAEAGDAVAEVELGQLYDRGEGVSRNAQEAEGWYSKAAEQGNAKAEYLLGRKYALRSDFVNALKWFRKSADLEYAPAKYSIGAAYELGTGVPKSRAEALKWIRAAADLGDPGAESDLSYRYQTGTLGVPKDVAKAAEWDRKCADHGMIGCKYALGRRYLLGEGVPVDYQKARDIFEEILASPSSKDGDIDQAATQMGLIYLNGEGSEQDHSKAFEYFSLATSKGRSATAEFELGNLYYEGKGVSQDYVLAAHWWQMSLGILIGDPAAGRLLASLYLDGLGVPKDKVTAYQWLEIAVLKGDEQARVDRDKLVSMMRSDELRRGDQAVANWGSKLYGKNWKSDIKSGVKLKHLNEFR